MRIKNFLKLSVMSPVLAGLIVGSIFFITGEIDDSPGLCVIAILLCTGLLYIGTRNAAQIDKKAKPTIVLPLLFGTVGVVCISKYLIAGVYDEPPGLILGGLVVSITLLCMGFIGLKKEINTKHKKSDAI